jgi:hypothetical protein
MSSMSHHQETCRCKLHAELAARRHECYRQLAKAILGSAAPEDDLGLARALARHNSLRGTAQSVTPIRRPGRAA